MLLELRRLTRHFKVGGPFRAHTIVRALDGVDLSVEEGETVALVGESGSGKTTIAKLVLMLDRPTSGHVLWKGADLATMDRAAVKAYRRDVQAVFQDPYASLNPRLRVGAIVAEPIFAHMRVDRRALRRQIDGLLEIVGLGAAAARLYPHEFSGGQRQRIAIARALALRPRMLVLDEPTSALDVSIRAQIVNLLLDIQSEFKLTYFLIAHDLALVQHFATRVAVIYLGQVVENGTTDEVFDAPRHPYTQALLAAVPRPDPDYRLPDDVATGEAGSALNPPAGCRFHPRCAHAMEVCRTHAPTRASGAAGGWATCHLLTPDASARRVPAPGGAALMGASGRDHFTRSANVS